MVFDVSEPGGGSISPLEQFLCTAVSARVADRYELRQVADACAGLSTVHLDFDISDTSLWYTTGDDVEILPCNPPELVEWFAERLGVQEELDCIIVSLRCGDREALEGPRTLRHVLSTYLDLSRCPTREAMEGLAAFLTDKDAHDVLLRLLGDHFALNLLQDTLSFQEFWIIYFFG